MQRIMVSLMLWLSLAVQASPELKLQWLGTNSYMIQFGNVSLLTDPFFTQYSIPHVLFSKLHSDDAIVHQVAEKIKDYPKPKAIFIGHAHYDHMLDTANLVDKMNWVDVPIYASDTAKNILNGYGEKYFEQTQVVEADQEWHQVAPGLRYRAIEAEHPPQVVGVMFYDGFVEEPLLQRPEKADQFKTGTTYAYLFELTSNDKKVTIYITSAASNAPLGFPNDDVDNVDVAILCVPNWDEVKGYPEQFIERLQPKYIIPAHFNDFFQALKSFDDSRYQLPIARLDTFLKKINQVADYERYREVLVLKVGQKHSMRP